MKTSISRPFFLLLHIFFLPAIIFLVTFDIAKSQAQWKYDEVN
jgi:hypothetical protein